MLYHLDSKSSGQTASFVLQYNHYETIWFSLLFRGSADLGVCLHHRSKDLGESFSFGFGVYKFYYRHFIYSTFCSRAPGDFENTPVFFCRKRVVDFALLHSGHSGEFFYLREYPVFGCAHGFHPRNHLSIFCCSFLRLIF